MSIERVKAVLQHEAEAILNIPATDNFDNAIQLIHQQVHEKGGKLVFGAIMDRFAGKYTVADPVVYVKVSLF